MAIDIRSLTTGEFEGSGLFEELMRTTRSHVENQYEKGQITGSDYSQVYLSALQASLQGAIQYLLAYENTNAQLTLIKKQIEQADKQNELLDLQREQLRIANETAQYNLDTMLPQQYIQLQRQTELVQEQINQAMAQTSLIVAQEAKVNKDMELTEGQIRDVTDKYENPTGGLNKAQYDRLMSEKAISDQKLLSEKAQLNDVVDGVPVGGVIGSELKLKQNQANSFLRNAEIQAAKLYADTFSVMYSTEAEGMDNQQWGLGSDESFEVFKKVAEGIEAGNGFDPTA